MSRLIKLDSVVIVEGKYDKITLENVIDATFVVTNGFGIYNDKNKQQLVKNLCKKNGAVIITDSDSGGNQIRAFLKNLCGGKNIVNVYLPQIIGKEKRKSTPSKEGFIGAEGMSEDIILEALKKSGVQSSTIQKETKITKADLYSYGLSGSENSKLMREHFCEYVLLPKGLSSNAFLDALNSVFTTEEFISEVEKWLQEQGKN